MKLGISSYTYPWSVGVGDEVPAVRLTASDLLARAQALGVRVLQLADGLELHRLSGAERAAIRAQADALGIDLEVGTRATTREELLDYLTVAQELRSPFLRVVLRTAQQQLSPEECVALLKQVRAEFEASGIVLAIETHESLRAHELCDILKRAGGDWVGVCFDTANSLGCFEPAETVMSVLRNYIVNVHLKDVTVRRSGHSLGFIIEGTPAGQGKLDLPAIISVARTLPRPGINAILEHWVPAAATLAETLAKEQQWAEESVGYLRRFIRN